MKNNSDVYDDGYLEIHDNILKFNNNVIQLANVSRICMAQMEPKQIPQDVWIGLIAGVVCLVFNTMIGFLIIVAAIFMIFKIMSDNNDLKYYLKIELNSGKNIYFNGHDKEFLKRIINVVENCFNTSNQNITIDLKNGHITNMQVGSNNKLGV